MVIRNIEGTFGYQKVKPMPVFHLRNMPEDVRKILLKIQMEKKVEKKVSQYSLQLTIYNLIREYGKKEK